MADHLKAWECYREAAACYEAMLREEHTLLSRLGESNASVNQHEKRIESAKKALADCEEQGRILKQIALEQAKNSLIDEADAQKDENYSSWQKKKFDFDLRQSQNRLEVEQREKALSRALDDRERLAASEAGIPVGGTSLKTFEDMTNTFRGFWQKKWIRGKLGRFLDTPVETILSSLPQNSTRLRQVEQQFAASEECRRLYNARLEKKDTFGMGICVLLVLVVYDFLLYLAHPDTLFFPYCLAEGLLLGLLALVLLTREPVVRAMGNWGWLRKKVVLRAMKPLADNEELYQPFYCCIHHEKIAWEVGAGEKVQSLERMDREIAEIQDELNRFREESGHLEEEYQRLCKEEERMKQLNASVDRQLEQSLLRVKISKQDQKEIDENERKRCRLQENLNSLNADNAGEQIEKDQCQLNKVQTRIEECLQDLCRFDPLGQDAPSKEADEIPEQEPDLEGMVLLEGIGRKQIFRHDGKAVKIEYQSVFPGKSAGEELLEMMRSLIEAFRRMNAPLRMDFHLVDPEGKAGAFMRDDWFVKRGICRDFAGENQGNARKAVRENDMAGFGRSRLFACGTEEEMAELAGRLREKLAEREAERMEENPVERKSPYQVLLIAVPRNRYGTYYTAPRGLARIITQCESGCGVLPILFVDKESVADGWVSCASECSGYYSADLSANLLQEEPEKWKK